MCGETIINNINLVEKIINDDFEKIDNEYEVNLVKIIMDYYIINCECCDSIIENSISKKCNDCDKECCGDCLGRLSLNEELFVCEDCMGEYFMCENCNVMNYYENHGECNFCKDDFFNCDECGIDTLKLLYLLEDNINNEFVSCCEGCLDELDEEQYNLEEMECYN